MCHALHVKICRRIYEWWLSGGIPVKAILCNDCGAVMSRFSNECKSCKRTNLSFHADRHSEEFRKRTAIIRAANSDYSRHVFVVALLLGFVVAIGLGHHSSPRPEKAQAHTHSTQTASVQTSVTR